MNAASFPSHPSIPHSSTNRPAAARALSVSVLWLVAGIVVLAAWLAGRGRFYTPGSDIGYQLGLVGSIMMLALLLYPLRKHIRFLHSAGGLRHWFKLHMFLGIAGPALILLHSTLSLRSLNAAVAFYSMLIVAGSGIIGRFMYTRIHHGLYGRKATIDELKTRLGISEGEARSRFHFAPRVDAALNVFAERAQHRPTDFLPAAWWFLTLNLRARLVRAHCMRDLRKILGAHARERRWEPGKLPRRLRAANTMLRNYLAAERDAAQFAVYERLFALWHVLHVPFVFMLVIAGVVHVIAVHMY